MDNSNIKEINDLKALLELSKMLSKETSLDSLLQTIISSATKVMNADRSTLFLYDEENNELRSKIAQNLGEIKEIRLPVGKGIAGEVAEKLKSENIKDAYKDHRFNQDFDKLTGFRTKSILCFPIFGTSKNLIGVIQVLNKKGGDTFDNYDEDLLEVFCSHAAIALERAKLIDSYIEKQRIEESFKLAREIQMSMIPNNFDFIKTNRHIDLYATIKPVYEVGGDFYDFFLLDNDLLFFCIGDVSGKGVPAALFMAITRTLINAFSKTDKPLDSVMTQVNKELLLENDASMFATIFSGILNTRNGKLSYCNCGHNPPFLITKDGHTTQIENPLNPALGIENETIEMGSLELNFGDLIFLYTDGVTEAANRNDDFFGEQKLLDLLKNNHSLLPENLVAETFNKIRTFTDEAKQNDDITILSIKYVLDN